MILAENFLQFLIYTNEKSPIINRQLFKFVAEKRKFETVRRNATMNGFTIRWIVLLYLAFTLLIRIINLRLSNALNDNPNSTLVETNVSIMIMLITL